MNVPCQRIAGFTNAAPLLPMNRGGAAALQRRPMRPLYTSYRKKTRVRGPMLCTGNEEDANVKHGLTITRQEILQRTRSGRAAKLRRWATLSEIDVPGGSDTRVDVWIVITRDRRDFRVRARVVSEILRTCDRCAKEYMADADGRFEVLLRTGDAKSEEEEAELVEALEEFGPGIGEIWLGDHVRDGVYLGVPTRSLCSDNCGGVEVRLKPGSGSVRYNFGDGRRDGKKEGSGGLGTKAAKETLMELKRRLEKEGL